MIGALDRTFATRVKTVIGSSARRSRCVPEIAEVLAGRLRLALRRHGARPPRNRRRSAHHPGRGACPCIVRVPANEPTWVSRVLDTGAAGVMVPHVGTAGRGPAAGCVAGMFPPRATAASEPLGGGFGARLRTRGTDNDICCSSAGRNVEAVRNIGEIATTPGVGAIFIGPFDLSASLGSPVRSATDVQSAIATVRDACAAAASAWAIFTVEAGSARKAMGEGYSLVCVQQRRFSRRRG